jgi:hypothetical protein
LGSGLVIYSEPSEVWVSAGPGQSQSEQAIDHRRPKVEESFARALYLTVRASPNPQGKYRQKNNAFKNSRFSDFLTGIIARRPR